MTKAEIMNCAAILAAGIMANESESVDYDVGMAVELMFKISEKLNAKLDPESEREYRQL